MPLAVPSDGIETSRSRDPSSLCNRTTDETSRRNDTPNLPATNAAPSIGISDSAIMVFQFDGCGCAMGAATIFRRGAFLSTSRYN